MQINWPLLYTHLARRGKPKPAIARFAASFERSRPVVMAQKVAKIKTSFPNVIILFQVVGGFWDTF